MPDFIRPNRELTIGEIVELTHAKLQNYVSLDRRIHDIAPLDTAGPGDISFLNNLKFLPDFAATRAEACFVVPRFSTSAPQGLAVLVTAEPYRDFVEVARTLFSAALRPSSLYGASAGTAPGAQVHALARLEAGVTVDPLAVIGPRAEIGSGSLIGAGAVIGPDVSIGRDCAVGAGASVLHALIGDRVVIHPGARIGQDGFGYLPDPRGHRKIPQIRRVIIQDDVEIGANTTIDRGSTRDTVIGEGTKIDNLVQIAHNVSIGRHCLIAGQTGIAGSTKVGDFVLMGGQAGIVDNVTIGDGTVLGACSAVLSNVPAGAHWLGYPAGPWRDWLKGITIVKRMVQGDKKSDDAEKKSEGGDR